MDAAQLAGRPRPRLGRSAPARGCARAGHTL